MDTAQLLDLPNEVLLMMFNYLDVVSTRKFASTCVQIMSLCIVRYPLPDSTGVDSASSTIDTGNTSDNKILTPYYYLHKLKKASCGYCNRISDCRCTEGYTLWCDCCMMMARPEMILYEKYSLKWNPGQHYSLLKCRYGCVRWYCGWCNQKFASDCDVNVNVDGWVICLQCVRDDADCAHSRSDNYDRINDGLITDMTLVLTYGIKSVYDVKYPKTRDNVELYKPCHNTVVSYRVFHTDNKRRVKHGHINKVRERFKLYIESNMSVD